MTDASTEARTAVIRLLALGNELLADDALGRVVAEEATAAFPDVEIVSSASAGFALLEHVVGADRLLVVDAVLTGTAPPGTVHVLHDTDVPVAFGPSPHYVGLWEVLALARTLQLPVPDEVVIIAVEAEDCTTLGKSMDPAVRAAVPRVLQLAAEMISTWRNGGTLGA